MYDYPLPIFGPYGLSFIPYFQKGKCFLEESMAQETLIYEKNIIFK